MPAREQVALEPALALVFAEHLHHPPVGGEVIVGRDNLGRPLLFVTSKTAARRLEGSRPGRRCGSCAARR